MAKVSMDLEAMKAAFAAKGGAVTRVESGVRAIESDRTIYAAMREGKRATADSVRDSAVASRNDDRRVSRRTGDGVEPLGRAGVWSDGGRLTAASSKPNSSKPTIWS